MAEPTLSIEFDDIANAVSLYLYGKADYTTLVAADQAKVGVIVNAGYRQFIYPPAAGDIEAGYDWKFLNPHTTLTTEAAYSTGTLTVVTTTCTLLGGTFPTWAATNGILTIDGTEYTVVSRDSGVQLTVSAEGDVAGEDDWTLEHDGNYTLPDDFGDIHDGFIFDRDIQKPNVTGPVSEGRILSLRNTNDSVAEPRIFAIRIKAIGAGATSQRKEVMLWPRPDEEYILHYQYEALADSLSTGVYPLGTLKHMETLKESCLAEAEVQMNDEYGIHYQKFITNLKSSIARDKKDGAKLLGYIGSSAEYAQNNASGSFNYTLTVGGTVIEG